MKLWQNFMLAGAVVSIMIGSCPDLYAQTKVGTAAATFLGISVSPRATSMGSAFTALANDASALYYNPGGLSRLKQSHVLFSHTEWLMGTDFNWLGFSLKLNNANTIGISFTQLDYGEEQVTTVDYPDGLNAYWSASDFCAGVTYSRNLTDRFSIGGTLKYVKQQIYNESGSALGLDIGLLFTTRFNDMKIGMTICNFSGDLQLDGKDLFYPVDLDDENLGNNANIIGSLRTDAWPLPLFFKIGLAMDVIKNNITRTTVTVDALRPSDNSEIINLGCEVAMSEMLFLRGGYKSLFRDTSEEGLTLGTGLKYKIYSNNASLDYCYLDFGIWGGMHMFSLDVAF